MSARGTERGLFADSANRLLASTARGLRGPRHRDDRALSQQRRRPDWTDPPADATGLRGDRGSLSAIRAERIVGVATDITAKKKYERQQQLSRDSADEVKLTTVG